ncbi:hypothetical protein [Glutamicibacter arilaitensis]|uniref:hypothetical protein n=1 Tax=Glutamicibacter arilaitensis TaxID=256701 RepID=UPI00384E445D
MKVPLHERERVVIKTREHSRVLRQPFVVFLFLTAGCAFLLGYLSRTDLSDWLASESELWMVLTLVLWFILVLIWCVTPWVRWLRTCIILTTERILFRTSFGRADLESIGLYSVRDLIAHTKQQAAITKPGALDVVLSHGHVRIMHVPAVSYFRTLAIEMMNNLHHHQTSNTQVDASNSEGIGQ